MSKTKWGGSFQNWADIPKKDDYPICANTGNIGQFNRATTRSRINNEKHQLCIDTLSLLDKDKIYSILDFGGSSGIHTELFTNFKTDKYVIIEIPKVCEYYQKKLDYTYLSSVKDVNVNIDIVYSYGGIQYIENPISLIEEMLKLNPQILIFERCNFIEKDSYILIQDYIGKKFPCWFININNLQSYLKQYNFTLYKKIKDEVIEREQTYNIALINNEK